jgi:hypothetical protein
MRLTDRSRGRVTIKCTRSSVVQGSSKAVLRWNFGVPPQSSIVRLPMTPAPSERWLRPAGHFAIAGIGFFVVAAMVSQTWRFSFAEEAELQRVTGRIEEIQLTGSKRRGPELILLVKVGPEARRYSQLDLRQRSPALATLKAGETIELDVDHFSFSDRRGAYWGIRRGTWRWAQAPWHSPVAQTICRRRPAVGPVVRPQRIAA